MKLCKWIICLLFIYDIMIFFYFNGLKLFIFITHTLEMSLYSYQYTVFWILEHHENMFSQYYMHSNVAGSSLQLHYAIVILLSIFLV